MLPRSPSSTCNIVYVVLFGCGANLLKLQECDTCSIVYFVLFGCGANLVNLQECDTMLIFVTLTVW